MGPCTVLLALSLLVPQAKSPSLVDTITTAPKQVSQDLYPGKAPDAALPSDLMGWHGWSYLQGATAIEPKIYDSIGDWTEVKARADAAKTGKASQWRLKVVIFTRTESDDRDASLVLRERRLTIESVQLAQVQLALDRFRGWVSAKFDGRVAITPDVVIETDWMRDTTPPSGTPFGSAFIQRYLEARINGGSYEAEDKIFRGPYNSVLYILPGAGANPPILTTVNRTPVAGLVAQPLDSHGFSSYLDIQLRAAWLQQVETRVKKQGFKGITLTESKATSDDPWPIACSLDEPQPQTYLSRLVASLELWPSIPDPTPAKLSKLPETEAKIVADPERGQVLKVTEAAGFRAGGIALPSRDDGMPLAVLSSAPTFSFQVKSASGDPIAIRLESSENKVLWISIGEDPKLVSPMPEVSIVSVPIVPNGKWQTVAIDLRPFAQKLGMANVVRMAIEPTPNAKLSGKLRPELIDYEFDDIKFSTGAGQPVIGPVVADATSDDPEARALFAAQAKSPSPEVGALLKDKNEFVRLNATAAYTTFKDPSVESSLISNSLDLDPTIAALALTALMAEGSDTAIAVVRRSVRVALFDYDKQTAARLLAETKDPKMADDVELMFNNPSWVARLSGVESLALIPSPSAGMFRLGFLRSVDPEIKLAVTRHADPNRDEDVSKLLWSAVNEPSDMVRAESDIKLIESTAAANQTEGYKGVRDDSKFARLTVLAYLADHPKEANRSALRMAVADKSAIVRAAALKAFAALEATTTTEEIANVLDDQDPNVQLALIDLAKKKGVKLPPATLSAMSSSQDPRVSSAAKGLTN